MKKVNPLQKFAAICVASAFALSSLGFVNVSSTSDIVDVAQKQITYAAFMKGYPDNTFSPDGNITRGETAALISRVLSRTIDPLPTVNIPFSDILPEHWAFGNVMEACIPHDFVGSIYYSVLVAHKQAVINGYEYYDRELVNGLLPTYPEEGNAVYYAYKDIDGNGVPELFIGAGEDAAKALYNIYTYHDGKPVRLFDFDFGNRVNCVVFPDGALAVSWSNSAFHSGKDFYKISADGFTPELIEGVSLISEDEGSFFTFHRITTESSKEITKSEYHQILHKYYGASPVYRGVADLNWASILEG